MSLVQLSLTDIAARLCSKDVSPTELTKACLDRIEQTEKHINGFVCIMAEQAMEAARQAESEIVAGHYKGPLHGVPVAVKDLFDIAGMPTKAGSRVRADHIADEDSASVTRLRAAGAIIIGKTHTHEFAYGVTTPSTRNPWDLECSPGGSSGGSGATVAAGSCYMALGTDTGGSVRLPASACGTVGLKPTFGRVSRFGVVPLSWSSDHVGTFTRTVSDAAVSFAAIAGYDGRDLDCLDEPVPDFSKDLEHGVKGLHLGIPRNYFFERVHPEVEEHVRAAIDQLEKAGAVITDVEVPLAELTLAVGLTLCMSEASAYHQETLRTRSDDYQEDVRILLEAGALIPAIDYITAQRIRTKIKEAWYGIFNGIDAVITPTTALPAAKRGQMTYKWPDGVEEPLMGASRLTAPANITGLPAISLPCGFSKTGLPIGLQVIGRPLEENTVMRIARTYEVVSGREFQLPSL